MSEYLAAAARVVERCRELARMTDVPGETTRLFLSPATREAQALLTGWMASVGLHVRTDAIGNVRGLVSGPQEHSPRLLIGSHIDTVPNAGAFDGPLGVILGIELIAELFATGGAPPFAIELIAFSEEEGVRFAKPFLGSLALVGQLEDSALAIADDAGITVADALRSFGLDSSELAFATVDRSAAAYLEFHIEQGPVLEAEGRALGVVQSIAGQTRLTLTFAGRANHAGTTPMGVFRRDALAAAAEWITEVERHASSVAGLVATVGRLEVPGGVGNVVPGLVTATLDVRHAQNGVRQASVECLLASAAQAGAQRGVAVTHSVMLDQASVLMDPRLTNSLAAAVAQSVGGQARLMHSGAGHDAMVVARSVPSAMLFLRSPGGLSHHPDESVLQEDVAAALCAGLRFVRALSL